MACRGLQQYMTVLMPNGDWSQEPMKQVLNTLFRRVTVTFPSLSVFVFIHLFFAAGQDIL